MARKKGASPDDGPKTLEECAGLGTENITQNDITWLGDDGSLEPDDYLKNIQAEDALRRICLCIVTSHPSNVASTARSRTPEDDRVQKMVEAGLGRQPRKGPPALDKTEILLAVAARYFTDYFNKLKTSPEKKVKLDPIIWRVLLDYGTDPDLDPVAKGNAIKPIREAFNKNKDRLLTLVTSDGQEALRDRDRKIAEVVRLLGELGILIPQAMKGLE